jgi:hypothetical protein
LNPGIERNIKGIEVQGNLFLKGNSEVQRERDTGIWLKPTVKRSVFVLVAPFPFPYNKSEQIVVSGINPAIVANVYITRCPPKFTCS